MHKSDGKTVAFVIIIVFYFSNYLFFLLTISLAASTMSCAVR